MQKLVVICSLVALTACEASTAAPAPDATVAKAPASQPAKAPAMQAKGTTPADRDQVDQDGVVRRGTPLDKNAPLTVATCMQDPTKYDKKSVKIAGTVDQVCAKKGCWWMLTGDEPAHKIRITAQDYGFFVPQDAKGKRAVVEGLFEVKTLSDEEAAHLAKDSGDPNAKPIKHEVRLVAAGLEMHPPKATN